MSPQLRRSETDRVIAGVAGGVAQRFGFNSTLVRLAWVVSVFFGGFGILIYVILWIALPKSPAQIPATRIAESATRAVRSPPRSSSASGASSKQRYDRDPLRSRVGLHGARLLG